MRSNIPMMGELPTVHHAYRVLLQEQKHKELSKLSHQSESMAFAGEKKRFDRNYGRVNDSDSQGSIGRNFQNANRSNKRGANYFCDHCKIAGHTKERCFKIHWLSTRMEA